MAALQITVGGTAQNVARLISLSAPVAAPSSITTPNFISAFTTLIDVDNPVISAAASLTNGSKFLENNITKLVVVEGFGTSPGTGGGSSEPVSKESWE